MLNTKPANSEIHEDQFLKFLVNTLDDKIDLHFGFNSEFAVEDIHEVLVGACADGTSVSMLCNFSGNSPPANTIFYHLRTKFEAVRLEPLANTLLRRDVIELLPK
jgi:hypothetical protein